MPWGWIVGGVLALSLLAAVVLMASRTGKLSERVDQAEGAQDEARKQSERMAGPMPGFADRARAALRELRRRGVRIPPEVAEAAVRRAERRSLDRDRDGPA